MRTRLLAWLLGAAMTVGWGGSSAASEAFDRAFDAYLNGEYLSAARQLDKLAEGGDPEAQYLLGFMLLDYRSIASGKEWVKAYVDSVEGQAGHFKRAKLAGALLAKAVAQDHAAAQYANWFPFGRRKLDDQRYLQSASAKGFPPADYDLFQWYLIVAPGPSDFAERIKTWDHLLRRAYRNDYPPAATTLGRFYASGVYGDDARPLGLKILLGSAELGHPNTFFYLSHVYSKGLGVKNDPVEALKWIVVAIRLGAWPATDGHLQELEDQLEPANARAARQAAETWLRNRLANPDHPIAQYVAWCLTADADQEQCVSKAHGDHFQCALLYLEGEKKRRFIQSFPYKACREDRVELWPFN